MESEFLFQDETKCLINNFLAILYNQLCQYGEAFIALDDSNILTAKLFVMPPEPVDIRDHDVPLLVIGKRELYMHILAMLYTCVHYYIMTYAATLWHLLHIILLTSTCY